MKVTICPICRLTPELTPKKVKCPKCGRTAFGDSLTETLTNWNNGLTSTEEKYKPVKEEVKPEVPFMNEPVDEPVEEIKEEKPKKAPVKRRKRSE